MAWERNFEKRVLKKREKELKFYRLIYLVQVRSFILPNVFKEAIKLKSASG